MAIAQPRQGAGKLHAAVLQGQSANVDLKWLGVDR
jgi:hypothetical protein